MWAAIIPAIIMAVSSLVQMLGNQQAAKKQERTNRDLAQFQADENQKLLDQQLQYNTPAMQMSRFEAAHLNPNLIYGQGNPGNQSAPLSYPDIKPPDIQGAVGRGLGTLSEIGPAVTQGRLAQSQIEAQKAATGERYAKTELIKLQTLVLEKNPALNKQVYEAMVQGWIAAAQIKTLQAGSAKISLEAQEATAGWIPRKMMAEINLLESQFRLTELNAQSKAEVINGQKFQNALLEVQKKFIADGDVGPQQFWQMLLIILTKWSQ